MTPASRRVLAVLAVAAVLAAARARIWAAWLPHRERLAAAGLLPALCASCTRPVLVQAPGAASLAGEFCRSCIRSHFADPRPGHTCLVCSAAAAAPAAG
jgi:hypothetical protein